MSTPPIVIIAEPDPMISSVLRVEFSHWDFAVFLAASSREAEDYAKHTVAHLVVLDIGRPDLLAFEACARIRRRPGYAQRPIVLTATQVPDRVRDAAIRAGATALQEKPYSVNDLFNALTPHAGANNPLLTSRSRRLEMAEPRQEWTPAPLAADRSGEESALARNGLLLPIVRGSGKRIPLLRRT